MGKTVDMKVRGKDALAGLMKQMLPAAVFEELEAAAQESADVMVAAAQDMVPWKSGALAESIVATPAGKTTPPYSQPGGQNVVPPGAVMVTAGNSEVRYAHLVEFGSLPHKNEGLFPGTENPGTEPRPFFWPAYRLIRDSHKKRTRKALNKAVREALKKAKTVGDG